MSIDQAAATTMARDPKKAFEGDVLAPGHAGYDEARTIWNAMVDKMPALIARCAATEDVEAAVRFAQRHSLPVSVRCGGHGVKGKALSDGGLTIDLTRMRRVGLNAGDCVVSAQGGCLLGARPRRGPLAESAAQGLLRVARGERGQDSAPMMDAASALTFTCLESDSASHVVRR